MRQLFFFFPLLLFLLTLPPSSFCFSLQCHWCCKAFCNRSVWTWDARALFHKDRGVDNYFAVPNRSQITTTTAMATAAAEGRRHRRSYFATCIPGLENVLAMELIDLGAHSVKAGKCGVRFSEPPRPRKEGLQHNNYSSGMRKNEDDDDSDDCLQIGDMEIGMKSVLWLRTAHRVMELVASTDDADFDHDEEGYNENFVARSTRQRWQIHDANDLYAFIREEVDVKGLLGDGRGGMLSLAVKCTLGGHLPRDLCHGHFTSLTVKNALVDSCRDLRSDGLRPNVDTDDPSVPLVIALRGCDDGQYATASLYRCLNGHESMHRRGYRQSDNAIHKAALKESLAAGLLFAAGWHLLVKSAKDDGLPAVLVDPMMGSGTFSVEAALIASDVAPGLLRLRLISGTNDDGTRGSVGAIESGEYMYFPPCVRWKSVDVSCWKRLLQEAIERAKIGRRWLFGDNPDTGSRNCLILGNELHHGAISLARRSVELAGVVDAVTLREGNCIDWHVEDSGGTKVAAPARTIVVVNPPWGLRLHSEEVEESWVALREFLRRECIGAEAWILSGNRDVTRTLRMKRTRMVPLRTANERLRWIQYHIFPPPKQRRDADGADETDKNKNKQEKNPAENYYRATIKPGSFAGDKLDEENVTVKKRVEAIPMDDENPWM